MLTRVFNFQRNPGSAGEESPGARRPVVVGGAGDDDAVGAGAAAPLAAAATSGIDIVSMLDDARVEKMTLKEIVLSSKMRRPFLRREVESESPESLLRGGCLVMELSRESIR